MATLTRPKADVASADASVASPVAAVVSAAPVAPVAASASAAAASTSSRDIHSLPSTAFGRAPSHPMPGELFHREPATRGLAASAAGPTLVHSSSTGSGPLGPAAFGKVGGPTRSGVMMAPAGMVQGPYGGMMYAGAMAPGAKVGMFRAASTGDQPTGMWPKQQSYYQPQVHQQQAKSRQQVAITTQPRVVPAPPFFLTNFVFNVSCKAGELRSAMETALRTQHVDFEYNPAKWKAKCYVYKPSGFVAFVVRCFSESAPPATGGNGSDANQNFIMELQRRKGCHVLFRSTYEALMSHLINAGWISGNSEAARRARAMSLLDAKPIAPPSTEASAAAATSGSGALKPISALDGDDLLSADGDDSGDDDEGSRGASRASGEAAVPPTETTPAKSAAATATVVDAFVTLTGMLASDFDDVALPAAQSIAALTYSKSVRRQLGKRAMAALAAATATASPRVSAPSMGAPSLPEQANFSVLQLFEALLARVGGQVGGDPYYPLRASLECRTAAALALVHLAKDKSCCHVLGTMFAVPRLLNGVAITAHGAASASLRRECLRAAGMLLTHGEADIGRRAVAYNCVDGMRNIIKTCRDLDIEFDRLADEVMRRLEEAAAARTPPASTTASPAAESN